MVIFNNNKTEHVLVIEIEINTYQIDFNTSIRLLKEEVLDKDFTVDSLKFKLKNLPKKLTKTDKSKIVNHCISSYYDYKRFLTEGLFKNT